ncbi:MAG TPA: ABC transporter substrate-binding protein, partial [Actinomycetota bacterium]|nr:ABC transporter substrate-binding protein [Actinomycetota bacterium]
MRIARPQARTRLIGTLACLAIVAAACGQYPNTHELALANGQGQSTVGTLDSSGGAQSTQGTLGTSPTAPSVTGGPVGGPAQPTGTSGAPAAPVNTAGHTTSGVTATSITIGIHAPITGAAPVTDESFQEGKDLYWKYGNQGKPFSIYGRQVKVIVEDDHYNPTEATLVCKKMVEQNHAFLLVGGAGTDQIVACAKYAATQPGPVPYLSAGVTQEPLEKYGNYFALSMSYPQQVPLLVDYMKKHLGVRGPKDAALVATNTANFDDAVEAWKKAMPGSDVYRPNKSDESAAGTYGQQLCNGPLDKYKVVFPLVAPLFWLQMAQFAACRPTWAGVGITMGLDAVAEVICGEGYRTNSAHFFSPAAAFTDV